MDRAIGLKFLAWRSQRNANDAKQSNIVHSGLQPNDILLDWSLCNEDNQLRKHFKVSRYPTLVVVGADGKILQVILGASEELKSSKFILEDIK